jgi:hypothetical protein
LWGGTKGGGGQTLCRFKFEYKQSHHAIEIGQHLVVGEAEDAISLGSKERVAVGIIGGRTSNKVRLTIELYNQFGRVRREVREVAAQWDLSTEVVTQMAKSAQRCPHGCFRRRHLLSERSSTVNRHDSPPAGA